ncbi:hypothetical protein [Micromonospora echinofusca]|uniref:Uncharacterized protein n=1 Tax=Micromonospora echinofusca TaxID=47858 RepID=A0ABS3VZ22_MICEH|nr:hypothetical protein [Micromonospora echinofusca]MBO4209790.1 hypothetical protein [Micromonospora echinofusca]
MNLATLTACATCHQALTESSDGGGIVYRHPVADDRHTAVPVDAAQVEYVFNRCHTCTGAPPVWNYRTGLIEIVALTDGGAQTYNDRWHVCHGCAQFIEADDSEALTAHCAALMRWHPDSTQYTILRTLHRGIVLSRQERTLLTTTDWPPARITADMLPKIRDRITRLLRGPANMPAPLNDSGQRGSLAHHLDSAPLYWINQEFTELVDEVTAGQPAATAAADIAPSPAGLITWPRPVGRTGQLAAVSWTPHLDGWHLVGYRSIGSGAVDENLMPALRHDIGWLVPIHTENITHGTTLDGRHPLGPLVTTWLLVNQQMAETVPAKIPKSTARAYQRSRRPAPEVRIVRIRPRDTTPATTPEQTASPRTRAKPDHRFWVSGHQRQQAYGPGRSLRRRIDIQPFLKGDDDLPIKLSTTVRVLGSPTTDPGSDTN